MAKLTVTLDCVFETSPFIKHDHKKFQERPVSVAELKKSLSGAERGEFGVQVVLVGATGEQKIGFLLEAAGLKKGGVFEWAIDQRQARATVTVKGEFVVALRAGVAPSIKNAGKKASLRLEKFTFKGGAWRGWEGDVQGQDPEKPLAWLEVKSWSVK